MSQTGKSVDSKAFRNALGQFPTGVTVVTALDRKGKKIGMTANSFSSVSLDPMLVLWSVSKTASCFREFVTASHFAIHVLNANQKSISNQFASNCDDRFQNIEYLKGVDGVPVLGDYSALFQCKTEHTYEGGDHVIIVGRVTQFDNREQPPLIFHAGKYADLDMPLAV